MALADSRTQNHKSFRVRFSQAWLNTVRAPARRRPGRDAGAFNRSAQSAHPMCATRPFFCPSSETVSSFDTSNAKSTSFGLANEIRGLKIERIDMANRRSIYSRMYKMTHRGKRRERSLPATEAGSAFIPAPYPRLPLNHTAYHGVPHHHRLRRCGPPRLHRPRRKPEGPRRRPGHDIPQVGGHPRGFRGGHLPSRGSLHLHGAPGSLRRQDGCIRLPTMMLSVSRLTAIGSRAGAWLARRVRTEGAKPLGRNYFSFLSRICRTIADVFCRRSCRRLPAPPQWRSRPSRRTARVPTSGGPPPPTPPVRRGSSLRRSSGIQFSFREQRGGRHGEAGHVG